MLHIYWEVCFYTILCYVIVPIFCKPDTLNKVLIYTTTITTKISYKVHHYPTIKLISLGKYNLLTNMNFELLEQIIQINF